MRKQEHSQLGLLLASWAILVLLLFSPVHAQSSGPHESLTLGQIVNLSESELRKIDIATMNLAAAQGLPGTHGVDSEVIRSTLDQWALNVASATAQRVKFFRDNPAAFDHSWAKFCAHDLLMTLNIYLGVHYNMEQRTNPNLAKSQDQFIHGIVQGTGGTCASLPVVFVAVGRRLGYPLKLAQAKSHYYVRWDDPVTGEQFNIDGSGDGFSFYDDDHYKEWPHHIEPEELEKGNYLKSLSPREELSMFLTTRGDSLRENGRWDEALAAYEQAVRVAPKNLFAAALLHDSRIILRRELADLEAAYQAHEKRRQSDPLWAVPGLPAIPPANPVSVRRTNRAPYPAMQSQAVAPMGAVTSPLDFVNGSGGVLEVPGQQSPGREVFEAMKRRNGVRNLNGE